MAAHLTRREQWIQQVGLGACPPGATPRQWQAFQCRMAGQTYREIGAHLGVTGERVRLLCDMAIRRWMRVHASRPPADWLRGR